MDEIKKGHQILIKRVIAAGLVFFVFVIIKFFISIVADSTSSKIVECTECFINNKCDKEKSGASWWSAAQSAIDAAKEAVENAVNGELNSNQ